MPSILEWKNSIFGRLFIMFIVVLLPIFILGYSLYNWGINSVKFEITSSMQAKMDSYIHNLENETQRIKSLQYNMFSDPGLSRLTLASTSTDDYTLYSDILGVQNRLETLKTSSRLINDISVYIPSIEKVITSSTERELEQEDLDLIKAYPSLPGFGWNKWGTSILMNQEYPELDLNQSEMPNLFIKIELSEREIKAMLQEMQVYEGSGAFMYSKKADMYVYSGDDVQIGLRIRDQLMDIDSNEKSVSGVKYLVTHAKSTIYDLELVQYTPEGLLFHKMNQYRKLFIIFACTSIIIVVIFSFSAYRFVHRPLANLVKAFRKVERGDMTVEINHKGKDEFRFIYHRFNTMIQSFNSLIREVYLQKILVQRAELKQLQAQINPHFLYNSFYTLQRWLKRGHTEDAINFAQMLGSYFQYVTRNSAEEVPLHIEVGHASTYSEIQSIRFSNRIKVEFQELPEIFREIIVPRLILQPFIENAYEHALEAMEENGLLIVSFEQVEDTLVIAVEDNGTTLAETHLAQMQEALEKEELSMEITAIINIHRRLRLKYGSNSGIKLSIGSLGGLKVSLHIELKGDNTDVYTIDRG